MKPINIFAETVDQKALAQFFEAMAHERNIEEALMPDVHAGYTLPIGSVIKSDNAVFPSYVGYDIGCGVAAFGLHLFADDLDAERLEAVRDHILWSRPSWRLIPSLSTKFDKKAGKAK